jgi:hypothetical protein
MGNSFREYEARPVPGLPAVSENRVDLDAAGRLR